MKTTSKNKTSNKASVSALPKTSAPSKGVSAEGLDTTPQLPSPDDIVLNLGFWLEMAQLSGKSIARERFAKHPADGVPQSECNKE